MSKTAK